MLVNWKAVATVVIVLFVLVIVLGNNPEVSKFISSVSGRIGGVVSIETEPGRPVKFSLFLDSAAPVEFSDTSVKNITITGNTVAQLQEGRIQVSRTLSIQDYVGSGKIGEKLSLQGKFEKVEWPEISIFLNGPIALNSSYTKVDMQGFSMKLLEADTNGVLSLNGTETKFGGKITVTEPSGAFVFERINATTHLSVDGYAHSISIPSAGINVK